MNILVRCSIMAIALLVLVDSIRQLQPHEKRKTKRKTGRTKNHSVPRANVSVIDLA